MNYFVQLLKDSPFCRVFWNRLVPVKQIPAPNAWTTRGTRDLVFVTAALCGDAREPEPVLWLDWTRCSAEQRSRLAKQVCELRGGTPAEFLKYMDGGGDLPIRVSQTDGAPAPFPL
jgi:hypothetical protein